MMHLQLGFSGVCLALLGCQVDAGCLIAPRVMPSQQIQPLTPQVHTPTSLKLDPAVFFQRLVDRYRGLHLYRDVVNVVQVTHREGQEDGRVETQITCEVSDGQLTVQTPASQARKSIGVDLPLKKSEPVKHAQQQYDLWLAPHMALKFAPEPLKHLRSGIDDGFVAHEAEAVVIDNKAMVHVELRGGCSAGGGDSVTTSEDCAATVNLYVNTDSMLIERIETEQRLPDGGRYSTTLEIRPEQVEGSIPTDPTAPI